MKSTRIFSSILASLFILMILGGAVPVAETQPVAPSSDGVIKATLQVSIPPAQVRTWEQMRAAALKAPAAPVPSFQSIPFLPTMDDAAYKAHKDKAAQDGALEAPTTFENRSAAPLAQTLSTEIINFDGVDSVVAGNFTPPDTHGAVGLNHFVEITNSHLDVYEKAAPNTRIGSLPLIYFFRYPTSDFTPTYFYDPRVIYDQNENRWIMSALARLDPPTLEQRFFFAVSQTADPLGAYYIYQVVTDIFGRVWDFPQLGLDRDAVIFTANFFYLTTFIDARMFAVAKSLIYNGSPQTLTPYMFTGLVGTLSPPLVLDENPNTYLVAAQTNDNKVTIYTLANSAGDPPTLSTGATIPVAAYTIPANAPQPGTINTLDTSDCRFVNAGTQIGNSLFQVHTIKSGDFAKCRFYEFDTVNKQVIQTGTFGRSDTSFDFNAAIAANRRKDVFVTWSSTDVANNVNAEVRYSGRLHTDPVGVIASPGSLLSGSNTFYSANINNLAQRWGDYSAVSLDPSDSRGLTAWIVNERILTNATWGSRIGRISWPPYGNGLPAIYLLLLLD
ncbi:MAG: hypothetical protein LJE96_12895 [Deltaproteobacteria bacterium]|nr:hypothetical protein [Deltaproteobacteria bacterium]